MNEIKEQKYKGKITYFRLTLISIILNFVNI